MILLPELWPGAAVRLSPIEIRMKHPTFSGKSKLTKIGQSITIFAVMAADGDVPLQNRPPLDLRVAPWLRLSAISAFLTLSEKVLSSYRARSAGLLSALLRR
jgi:hypothetical protein